jgi:hypothetical protein
MFAASAVLGPLCDGLHSAADVLHYKDPTWLLRLQAGPLSWGLETCWWTPLLFGVAGVIIGVGVPALDELAVARADPAAVARAGGGGSSGGSSAAPAWPAVLLCISLFVVQYWSSGWLQHALLDGAAAAGGVDSAGSQGAAASAVAAAVAVGGSTWPVEDGALLAAAVGMWAAFDRTPQVGLLVLGG